MQLDSCVLLLVSQKVLQVFKQAQGQVLRQKVRYLLCKHNAAACSCFWGPAATHATASSISSSSECFCCAIPVTVICLLLPMSGRSPATPPRRGVVYNARPRGRSCHSCGRQQLVEAMHHTFSFVRWSIVLGSTKHTMKSNSGLHAVSDLQQQIMGWHPQLSQPHLPRCSQWLQLTLHAH